MSNTLEDKIKGENTKKQMMNLLSGFAECTVWASGQTTSKSPQRSGVKAGGDWMVVSAHLTSVQHLSSPTALSDTKTDLAQDKHAQACKSWPPRWNRTLPVTWSEIGEGQQAGGWDLWTGTKVMHPSTATKPAAGNMTSKLQVTENNTILKRLYTNLWVANQTKTLQTPTDIQPYLLLCSNPAFFQTASRQRLQ